MLLVLENILRRLRELLSRSRDGPMTMSEEWKARQLGLPDDDTTV